MLEERIIYLNGDFIPWGQARVHLMSHSFGRGSAIFEIFGFHETVSGTAVFRLDEHIHRLFNSAKLTGMQLPGAPEELQEAVLATIKANDIRQGVVKVLGFYPQIMFMVDPPAEKAAVAIIPIDLIQDFGDQGLPFEKGVTVCISQWRKTDPGTVPVEAKAAANYLNGMMARADARKRGFEDAVMLDTQGFIAEGAIESIFLVKGDRLMTPSLGTVLSSITRKSILQAANIVGIETYEGRLKPSLLYEADEIFMAHTTEKVIPVRQIENRVLKDTPGPMARRLKALMTEIVTGRDTRFKDWLFFVK